MSKMATEFVDLMKFYFFLGALETFDLTGVAMLRSLFSAVC